jgi:hypothetical protein
MGSLGRKFDPTMAATCLLLLLALLPLVEPPLPLLFFLVNLA